MTSLTGVATIGHRPIVRTIAIVATALALASCGAGSNLPDVSRSISVTLPSRTPIASRTISEPSASKSPARSRSPADTTSSTSSPILPEKTATPTKTSQTGPLLSPTATEAPTSGPEPTSSAQAGTTEVPAATASGSPAKAPAAKKSSSPIWPWILLTLVVIGVIGVIVAIVVSMRSKRAAAAAARRRALDVYATGMALHDEAAVLRSSPEADRPRILGELSVAIPRISSDLATLATEPAMRPFFAEIQGVQQSLGGLHRALQAQVDAGRIDPDLMRDRLTDLQAALDRFVARLSSTPR